MLKTIPSFLPYILLSVLIALASPISSLPLMASKTATKKEHLQVDVCVYGATAAGIVAAYSARSLDKTVVVIEPTDHIGGMTTGGLGYTDIGNKYAISGLSKRFYRLIGEHYNKFEQWSFPPSVATKVLNRHIDDAQLQIITHHTIKQAHLDGRRIESISLRSTDPISQKNMLTVQAKQFIDCSYEGDLMAASGVSYFVGREDNTLFEETLNGVQLHNLHQFPDSICPYRIKGDASSGFCWGITEEPMGVSGKGDRSIQAYNYRLCLTNNDTLKRQFHRPAQYDSTHYELLVRVAEKCSLKLSDILLINWQMPDEKYDVNNNGPFSTDMIGMNFDYIEASFEEREAIANQHRRYIEGLLYFLSTDKRMPQSLREEAMLWGYVADEFISNHHFPTQLYVREARRLHGEYVMTQHNCQGDETVEDGIAMAAYGMDSHNCRRLVVNGMVKNEGDVQFQGFSPFPISYRSMTPRPGECTNLLVPVCLSATHIAYGSIRMEPVFMTLAQSAGVAATMAINNQCEVQQIDTKQLRRKLKEDPYLDGSTPEILVDDTNVDKIRRSDNWFKRFGECYKTGFMFSWASSEECFYTFLPPVKTSGQYDLYFYCTAMSDEETTDQLGIDIITGAQLYQTTINPKLHAGDWAHVGSYSFEAGEDNRVVINGKRSKSPLVADAILLVPKSKTENYISSFINL